MILRSSLTFLSVHCECIGASPIMKRLKLDSGASVPIDGRTRQIPDCPGNWNALVFCDAASLRDSIIELHQKLQSKFDWAKHLEIFPELHLSLCRPTLIRSSSLDSFRIHLLDVLTQPTIIELFPMHLSCRSVIALQNDAGNRQFFAVKFEEAAAFGHCPRCRGQCNCYHRLLRLIDGIDDCMARSGLKRYYDDRILHVSWSSSVIITTKPSTHLPIPIVMPGDDEVDSKDCEESLSFPVPAQPTDVALFDVDPITVTLQYSDLICTFGKSRVQVCNEVSFG